MTHIFHVVYQPHLNKTLSDKGVKEINYELTPEQFAGIQLALYAIFGHDADKHIQIFGVAEPIDLESYIVPQEESSYSQISIHPGNRQYTVLLAGPRNYLLAQFDKPHYHHHHHHHENIQEDEDFLNENNIADNDKYNGHLGLNKKEKEKLKAQIKEIEKKHQWDFLQGAANAYKWFGLDYHTHIREIYDWNNNIVLRMP